MQQQLIANLHQLASEFRSHAAYEMSTLGRKAAGDWRFFDRLNDDGRTFTVRKYDEVVLWFSANWPAETAWPVEVQRPAVAARETTA